MKYLRYLLLLPLVLPTAARADSLLARIFPNGGQRGTRVKLLFSGEKLPQNATLLVDGDGIKSVGPIVKGVGEIEIAPNAAPGVRQLRLAGSDGTSTPRPFAIGTLPEQNEKEPNDTPAQAEKITQFPVTINGNLPTRPDLDLFRVSLKKGQCLVLAGESRALGCATNLLVRVKDTAWRELVVQMDSRTRDPLVGFTAPADGEYLIEIQEVLNNYSGITADYVYRFTLTLGPWIDSVFPAGVQRGQTAHLSFGGYNLGGQSGPSRLEADVAIPADAPRRYELSAGDAPNRVTVIADSVPDILEPGLTLASAVAVPQPVVRTAAAKGPMPYAVTVPVAANGTFGGRGDVDRYQFTAKAGEVLLLDVDARELGSYADPVLQVLDSSGKLLSTVDDAEGSRDPRLLWTAPANDTYTVAIRDVASGARGGPAFFYHLSIAPPVADLRLSTPAPTITIKPGAKLELPLTLQQSYQPSEVTFRVEGLPAGVTAAALTAPASARRAASAELKLVLTATAEAKFEPTLIRVVAVAGNLSAPARGSWILSTDRSGTLVTGSTEYLLLAPTP